MILKIRMVGGFQVEEKRKESLKKKKKANFISMKGRAKKDLVTIWLGRDVGIKVRLND